MSLVYGFAISFCKYSVSRVLIIVIQQANDTGTRPSECCMVTDRMGRQVSSVGGRLRQTGAGWGGEA